jgi:glycosyltransferase involved in cell wall biosynthesis
MRILWFINTPILVGKNKDANVIQGGWITSLQKQLSALASVQLAVAYPDNQKEPSSFLSGKTTYYSFPAFSDKGIFKGWPARWRHLIEPKKEVNLFLSIVESYKPDIIHIFGSERHYGLMSEHTKVPVILQIQGNLTVCYQKWFSGLTFFEVLKYCNKKNLLLGYGIFHQYYLLKKRAAREQEILASCKVIVGRTEWDRRIMRVFAPGSRYYHCEELIRDEFYERSWQPKSDVKAIILSTLSPIVYKGLEIVLKTAALLIELGGFEFEWHIAGVSGKEELTRIIERAQNLRFKDQNIKFLGTINAKELAGALVDSHIYVHPSHIENSPNSVCEAMITGIPVIATYAGGTPSILLNNEEGILVQDGDPYALAGAILNLNDSPQTMMTFSDNARQKALSRHNPESVVKELIGIYINVIDS